MIYIFEKLVEKYMEFLDDVKPQKTAAEILDEEAPKFCNHWECMYYGCPFRENYLADAEHFWFLPKHIEDVESCMLYEDR